MSLDHFLTYVELLARRHFGDEVIDEFYVADAPPPPFIRTEERRQQIARLEAMFSE